MQSALGGIGGSVNALLGSVAVLGVKLGLEETEGNGGLSGGAGLGDYVDGEVVVAKSGEKVGEGLRAERIAGVEEFDARGGADGFDEGAVTEIGAADADTDEILGVGSDGASGGLDSSEFVAIRLAGEIEPAAHGMVGESLEERSESREVEVEVSVGMELDHGGLLGKIKTRASRRL